MIVSNRFKNLSRVEKGGFIEVLLAFDLVENAEIVLQRLRVSSCKTGFEYHALQEICFYGEIQHSAIPTFYGVFIDQNEIYLALEKVGVTLQ
jgi:serine/threonine protein kinase